MMDMHTYLMSDSAVLDVDGIEAAYLRGNTITCLMRSGRRFLVSFGMGAAPVFQYLFTEGQEGEFFNPMMIEEIHQ